MAKLVVNEGLALFIARVLSANCTLRLYTNNHIPAPGDVAASYTEMTGIGYAPKTLASGSWVFNGVEATYPNQAFTFTAGTPVNVYGYYVTNAADGKVLFAENFTGGPWEANQQTTINITPRTSAASG